jgi:hypothetical protein
LEINNKIYSKPVCKYLDAQFHGAHDKHGDFHNDIALILIELNINFITLSPILLNGLDSDTVNIERKTAYAFGKDQIIQLEILSKNACKILWETLKNLNYNEELQKCGKFFSQTKTGDSGLYIIINKHMFF